MSSCVLLAAFTTGRCRCDFGCIISNATTGTVVAKGQPGILFIMFISILSRLLELLKNKVLYISARELLYTTPGFIFHLHMKKKCI